MIGSELEQQFSGKESKETKEQKRKRLNRSWYDRESKKTMEGGQYSLYECYDRAIERSNKIFEATKKVAQQEIPKDKYILYINSTMKGLVRHKDIKLIDEERLQKMYLAETGSLEINPEDFNNRNMRHCLGFEVGDDRFRAINAFKDEMPKDLSNCIGIVFSGSEADITDETHLERIEMTEKARGLVKSSHELKIPKLGICFGGQLLANEMGVQISWILDEEGNKKRITGLNEVSKAPETDEKSSILLELPKDVFYVAKNHGQRIEENTIPVGGEILAKDSSGEVEVVYFGDKNILCLQCHPEAGTLRLDIGESLNDDDKNQDEIFRQNPDEIRSVIFPNFLKLAGRYNAENKQ